MFQSITHVPPQQLLLSHISMHLSRVHVVVVHCFIEYPTAPERDRPQTIWFDDAVAASYDGWAIRDSGEQPELVILRSGGLDDMAGSPALGLTQMKEVYLVDVSSTLYADRRGHWICVAEARYRSHLYFEVSNVPEQQLKSVSQAATHASADLMSD
jgi:hypothetical protein